MAGKDGNKKLIKTFRFEIVYAYFEENKKK